MSQTDLHRRVMSSVWYDVDPYSQFPKKLFAVDTAGWNSTHQYLWNTIVEERPQITAELGVWKGGSTLFMAQALRDHGIEGVVIAVDTWLGSSEHWSEPVSHAELCFEQGYPSMFKKFIGNVVSLGLTEYVVPLPLDSANAVPVLAQRGLLPSVIHIDGAHDLDAVAQDLHRWWPLLATGGTMICDDYDPDKLIWPEVQQAVETFLSVTPHAGFECIPYKCRFKKAA